MNIDIDSLRPGEAAFFLVSEGRYVCVRIADMDVLRKNGALFVEELLAAFDLDREEQG